MIRQNVGLKRLVIARILAEGVVMAMPFYALYAQRELRVGLGLIGTCLISKGLGKVVTGPLWGVLGDRFGAAWSFVFVTIALAAAPFLALAARPQIVWVIPTIFFLLGAIQDGVWMTSSNTMLTLVRDDERPLAVGVVSLCQAPGALLGIMGGMIATKYGYVSLFTIAALFGVCCIASAIGLARTIPIKDCARQEH